MLRILTLALLLFGLLLAPTARAHEQGRSYCSVHSVPGGLDLTLETAAEHLGPVLGLASPEPSETELKNASGRLLQTLEDRVQARTPAGACRVEIDEPKLVTREARRQVEATLHFHCPAGPVTLSNAFRLDVDPASEIVCAIDGAAWVFRRGAEQVDVGTPPTLGETLGSFVRSGALHVLGGIDHVLFVVVLLLAAASARADGLGAGLRAMVGVVTGFTLGHSITLIAAGLGVIRLEPRLTESVIALSIVYVGVENIARQQVHARALTASLFGLVHGFGFASVLAETELPRRGAVWALLAFNVGIELAQLAIVIVLFPLLTLLARRGFYRSGILVPGSASVALLATLWFVKRAAGLEFLPWLGS